MGRLMVITSSDLAPGFELAGVETFAAEDPAQAQALLRELMAGDEASLIAIRQDFLHGVDGRLQREIDRSYRPLVMAIPGGTPVLPGEERRQYIAELIRRAIGYHITFGPERPKAGS
jgi:V/A-type H+/Na+-transporting ATPase subunit F